MSLGSEKESSPGWDTDAAASLPKPTVLITPLQQPPRSIHLPRVRLRTGTGSRWRQGLCPSRRARLEGLAL
jgi:hypothetical protein